MITEILIADETYRVFIDDSELKKYIHEVLQQMGYIQPGSMRRKVLTEVAIDYEALMDKMLERSIIAMERIDDEF